MSFAIIRYSLSYIMKHSPQCTPEKSEIFLAVGHSPYHSRYMQTSTCKHVRSAYSRLALLIAYVYYSMNLYCLHC